MERVWVLRRSGVRRAKAGEDIWEEEGNEGGEESVGVCFDLFFPLCPSGRKEFFFLVLNFLFLDTWELGS